jgi:hypothetical protein
MDIDVQSAGILGTILVIVTIVVTWQKIVKNAKKAKEDERATNLAAAKEADRLIRTQLEAKIEKLESQLNNLEISVTKDLIHLKDNYTSEIKNLGDKIEVLRDELNQRHSTLIDLLSKIVVKK